MTDSSRPHREYSISVENLRLQAHIDTASGGESLITRYTLHTHTYSELFVCMSGQGCITTENGEIGLLPGDALLMPAGYQHRLLQPQPQDEICYVAFSMTQRGTRTAFDLWRQLKPLRYRGAPQLYRAVPEICRQIAALYKTQRDDCRAALQLMLTLADLAAAPQSRPALTDAVPTDPVPVDRLVTLELLLERQFAEDITPKTVAAALHVSPRQLARLMQQQYGKTFGQVLTEKRLTAASHLLANTDLSVEQISRQVGFDSVSAFYRGFKQLYAMTPGAYRAKKGE